MVIYGVALLAFCYITGVYIGDVLGAVLGVKANVGGVGFAMLLLIIQQQPQPDPHLHDRPAVL